MERGWCEAALVVVGNAIPFSSSASQRFIHLRVRHPLAATISGAASICRFEDQSGFHSVLKSSLEQYLGFIPLTV